MGYPENEEEEFSFIKNEMSLKFIKSLPKEQGTIHTDPRL